MKQDPNNLLMVNKIEIKCNELNSFSYETIPNIIKNCNLQFLVITKCKAISAWLEM